ncbi:MAG: hypothetical protein HY000_38815, partial [Planctomycetes bacterium]|nr:hypothetical protein [Planctomycetota bacterium]
LPERREQEHPDLLAAKALFDPLVVKVPELLAGGWLGAIRKEALEAARKVLGGATGNQIATGGGDPGADADETAGMEDDPNAGFVGRPTAAGVSGAAGFAGGQAGGPPGGPAGRGGTGRGMPGVPGGAGSKGMTGGSGSAPAGGVSGSQPRSGGGNAQAASKSPTKKPIQTTKAETIMLRFVDYTVEPEHTYQYRLKVVVANPNYNHPFVVNDDISKPERLEGDWSDPTPPVLVEEDTKYYVLEKTKIPTEVEKIKLPEAKFEVHKWIADFAEWQLESFTARAGDTIGKMVSNHMMVTFDNIPEKKKTEVDFSTDELVLDVTGSSKSFNVDGTNFIESSPADVLVVDKLGELVSYNELAGKNNPARKEREKLYKDLLGGAIEPEKAGKKGDSTSEANKADDFEGNRVPSRKDKN